MSVIKTAGKHGFEVGEYKGEFGLTATYAGTDGKDWQKWGLERVSKDKHAEKDRPFKIVLGDRGMAEKALLGALFEITGVRYVPENKMDDIPF